jgi:hypothetical protein
MSERGDKEAVVDTPEKGTVAEEDLSVRMESVKVVQTAVIILDKLRAVPDICATVPVHVLCAAEDIEEYDTGTVPLYGSTLSS